MNVVLIVLTLFMVMFSGNAVEKNTTGPLPVIWVIEKKSFLTISGSSNVSSFICGVKEYLQIDSLISSKDDKNGLLLFSNRGLKIAVRRFDCNATFMTEEFCKTLKADQCPDLIIRFISIEPFDPSSPLQKVQTELEIELANVIRRMHVQMLIQKTDHNKIRLNGSKMLQFSDFNLVPPQKLAGIIRVNEAIKVDFELYFKAV